jgi:preprotein translocase subunit YajC
MGDPSQGGSMMSLLFMGAIFLVFYLFIIRPQSKKQKEIQKKISDLKKNDKIVTSGGIIAIINSIDEDTVLAEIDSGVKARFTKASIVDVNPPKNESQSK